ncbi:MAG TPA: hypothetical protein VI685_26885 [Candidatus Angelobacter sp.]
MTRAKAKKANEYKFRSYKLRIPEEELITAVQQSRRLHDQLMDDLMEQMVRQAVEDGEPTQAKG